jgi:hypothetical protein
MTTSDRSRDRRPGGRGGDDDAPTPLPNLPAGTERPVFEGVILSDLESEYIARHFEHQRRAASPSAAVEVRRAAPVARRPRPALALRQAGSAVRRGTNQATVYMITRVRGVTTHERIRVERAAYPTRGRPLLQTGWLVGVGHQQDQETFCSVSSDDNSAGGAGGLAAQPRFTRNPSFVCHRSLSVPSPPRDVAGPEQEHGVT